MNKDMLSKVIKATILGEKHLGENLKQQCVNYLENLEINKGKTYEEGVIKGFSLNVKAVEALEEKVKQLQEEIKCEDNLNKQLVEECQKFDDNWIYLKNWLKSDEFVPSPINPVPCEVQMFITRLLNKMETLEKGSDK